MSTNSQEIEMTAREEFEAYKADYEKKLVKRSGVQAIVLGLSTVVAVLGMLYGLINSVEAGAQRDAAIKLEQDAVAAKLDADKQRDINNKLQLQNDDLKKQLGECKSGN